MLEIIAQAIVDWSERVPSGLALIVAIAMAAILLVLGYGLAERFACGPNSSFRAKVLCVIAFGIVAATLMFLFAALITQYGPDAIGSDPPSNGGQSLRWGTAPFTG